MAKEIFIITCYQYEPTVALSELLSDFGECFYVLDRLCEDYLKIKSKYESKIISEGNFGYYSIDEAIGRLNMFKNLLNMNVEWDMVHVISQNCLPTDAFLFRSNFIDFNKSYVFMDPNKHFLSNYASYTKGMVMYLNRGYDRCMDNLLYNAKLGNFIVAPSEEVWFDLVSESKLPIEKGDARRFYVDTGDYIYGNHLGWEYGYPTKRLSPLTLKLSGPTINILSDQNWYLFARKFDYNSAAYKWQVEEFLKVKALLGAFYGL